MNPVRTRIPDDVREILRRSAISGNVLTLPGQLDRPTYVKVDKALKAIGGKWDRKAGGHTFPFDPRTLLDEAVEQGSVVDRKKTLQFFETPSDLAREMVGRAGVGAKSVVLEPSAGHGRIVRELLEAGCEVFAVEIDQQNCEMLEQLDCTLAQADFLEWGQHTRERFDAVVMNPPFSNAQDISHITAAWALLKPGGTLVALAAPGFTFHQTKKAEAFREWLDEVDAEVIEVEAGTFDESGTKIATRMIVASKPAGTVVDFPDTFKAKGDPEAELRGRIGPWVIGDNRCVVDLPIALVEPDPEQPRKTFPLPELHELASSIRQNGLIQPITVRQRGDGGYIITAGERRFRAHQIIGAETVACLIDGTVDPTDTKVKQIVENDQRQDVAPLEQAKSYQAVIDRTGWTVNQLATRLGKAPHRIEERLALLKLDDRYQHLLSSGNLKPSEAFEMSRLSTAGQSALFQAIKGGQCKTYQDLRVASTALVEAEQQTSFELVAAAAPPPPTKQERQDAGVFEFHVARIAALLRSGISDNQIEAVHKVNPNDASRFADMFAAMQIDMRRIEVALRQVAVKQ